MNPARTARVRRVLRVRVGLGRRFRVRGGAAEPETGSQHCRLRFHPGYHCHLRVLSSAWTRRVMVNSRNEVITSQRPSIAVW